MRLRTGSASHQPPAEPKGPIAEPTCPSCGQPMQAKGTRMTVISNEVGSVATFLCERCERIVQRAAEPS